MLIFGKKKTIKKEKNLLKGYVDIIFGRIREREREKD